MVNVMLLRLPYPLAAEESVVCGRFIDTSKSRFRMVVASMGHHQLRPLERDSHERHANVRTLRFPR